jgi:hypothetical protein
MIEFAPGTGQSAREALAAYIERRKKMIPTEVYELARALANLRKDDTGHPGKENVKRAYAMYEILKAAGYQLVEVPEDGDDALGRSRS